MRARTVLVVGTTAVCCLVATICPAEVREWIDQTGAVRKSGELERVDGKWVHLRLVDGQSLKVPIDWLSEADQAFVKSKSGGDGIEAVIVEGVGADVESARRDAYRAAVRQVLGALVDTKTLVENDQLITDRVVVFSDGFVDRVEDLPAAAVAEAGFTRLRVKAFVKAGKVADSLRKESIAVVGPVMQVEDADSLYARVLTAQDRAASARELFLAAVKDYPANCFQAEVFPLTDKNVRVDGNDVECNTRIKISVRQKEYEEFARRLVAYLETEKLFGRGEFELDTLKTSRQLHRALNGRWESGSVTEGIFTGEFGKFLSRHFDGLGDNQYLDVGSWGSWRAPWAEGDKQHVVLQYLEKSKQERPGITVVCRTASLPYRFEWFLTDPSGDEWASSRGNGIRCSLAAKRADGKGVANRGIVLNLLGKDFCERNIGNTGIRIRAMAFVPGWYFGAGGYCGPALEFTLPITVPASEFRPGLKFECTLENLPMESAKP